MLKKLKWILILAVVLGGGLTFMLVKTTAPFGLRYKEVPTAADNATVAKAFEIITGSAPKLYEKRFGLLPGPGHMLVKVDDEGVILEKEPIDDDKADLIRKGSEILSGDKKE